MEFINTQFYDLNTSSNGGAINVDDASIHVIIARCAFCRCTANRGGAADLTCISAGFYSNVVELCNARSGASVFVKSNINVRCFQSFKSPCDTQISKRDAFYIFEATHNEICHITNFNSTDSAISDSFPYLLTHHPVVCTYSVFKNGIGFNGFTCDKNNGTPNYLSFINFIDKPSDCCVCTIDTSKIYLSHCSFINNAKSEIRIGIGTVEFNECVFSGDSIFPGASSTITYQVLDFHCYTNARKPVTYNCLKISIVFCAVITV